MKKINFDLILKSVPVVALFVLAACAHTSDDVSKPVASQETSAVPAVKTAVSLQSWKPLFVAASPVEASQQVSTAPASVAPQLKLDRKLDSLKYAIYFEYASANLNPTGKAALEYLQGDAKLADAIEVVGRADPSGNAAKNEKLAQARAISVRQELLKYGVRMNAINVKSYVALQKAGDRIAYKQNLPTDLSAASRRADVDMLVKPNVVSKLTVHSNFAVVPG